MSRLAGDITVGYAHQVGVRDEPGPQSVSRTGGRIDVGPGDYCFDDVVDRLFANTSRSDFSDLGKSA